MTVEEASRVSVLSVSYRCVLVLLTLYFPLPAAQLVMKVEWKGLRRAWAGGRVI